ncbi:helix-turn-helix transcriptional regulator [Streptomyces sp. NBC_01476]
MEGSGHREYGSPAAGPIGAALAVWRARRGLSQEELSARAGLDVPWVEALEAGHEWVDRRRTLMALASALGLDAGELTGQPYPPLSLEHAEVRAVAYRVRRILAGSHSGTGHTSPERNELEHLLVVAEAAEGAGDEHGLALAVPPLISAGGSPRADQDDAAELRSRGHAVAAGLLRRLGYRDLAWLLLHRAVRTGGADAGAVQAEQVRLLLDLGLPEQALVRVHHAEGAQLRLLEAVAHALAGRLEKATSLLDAVAERAESDDAHAVVAAVRVAVAVEAGDFGAAAEYALVAQPQQLLPAARTALLVHLAAAAAHAGRTEEAAEHLEQAEATAPLRFLLDPFARELMAALSARVTDPDVAVRLRDAAQRAGLP